MKMTKVFAVVVLALVLSADFESVAEARRVHPNHHNNNKLSKKHHHELEQPVIVTIASIVGIVGGVITIVDKIAQVAEGGGCMGPRRERSDDEDYEEQPGSGTCDLSTKDDLRTQLVALKSLVSKIDLSKPVTYQDGQYFAATTGNIESDLDSARTTAVPTKFKLTPTTPIGKTVPTDLKKVVRNFKRMDGSELVKKVGTDLEEEEPVLVTIAGIVGIVSGAITITDAIVRATRRGGRRSRGRGSGGSRGGHKLEEETGSGDDLPTYVFDSQSFWGEASKVTDQTAVEKQRAREVKALLRTMVDGLANIDPDSIDLRDGEWTVPIKITRS